MAIEPGNDSQGQEDQGWLRRQVQRLRDIRRRDVVIAQVGKGARNVVIGTRNVQINVAGRNLTLPVLAVPLLLLIIFGFLVYPLVEPIWNPAQMPGKFNIAVAQFGEIGEDGQVRASNNGRMLSGWLFDGLYSEYQRQLVSGVELVELIEIWHDSRTDTEQNVRLGSIAGDTVQARQAAAARLAERIGAHMVVYGNVVAEGELPGLDLEFYLRTEDEAETVSMFGLYHLGKRITFPTSLDLDDPKANIRINEPLQVRVDALFWLTMGFTQQMLGRSEQALETLRLAEGALTNWPEEDGKEILYFFIGREELFLGQLDAAEASFRKALEIEPDYARAQVGLGSTYFIRALGIQPEERLDDPKDLEQALDHHRTGLELALAAKDPLIEAAARIALAKSYYLLGETHYFLNNDERANQLFDLAIAELEQVTPLLTNARQYRLLAQAYEAQGAAYLQQGDILRRQRKPEASRERFELARTAYRSCIKQGEKAPFDEYLHDTVIEQGCQRYIQVTEEHLQKLEGEQL